MSTFTNTVRKLTVDECDRQKRAYDAKKADDIERLGFFSNSMSSISLWRIAGSAGRAVTWLEQLDVEHPDARPHDLVEQLEMRIEDEISAHPRTFTVKHLHGVLEYARQAAEEQLVDDLMEALGITPQPWQSAQIHAAVTTVSPIPSGITVDEFTAAIDVLRAQGELPASAIFDETPILALKRPWWRRAGAAIATWWLDVWHNVPQLSNDALFVVGVALGATVWLGAVIYCASGGK